MSNSSHYNQQTEVKEVKQCKSEVEEMCIHQNLESGYHIIYIWKQILGSMLERISLKKLYGM